MRRPSLFFLRRLCGLALVFLVGLVGLPAADSAKSLPPFLEDFLAGRPLNVPLPAEKGGGQVTVALGAEAPAALEYHRHQPTAPAMTEVLLPEPGPDAFQFYAFSQQGASSPIIALLARSDLVVVPEWQPGALRGLAFDGSPTDFNTVYEVTETQYPGVLLLSCEGSVGYSVRLAPEIGGSVELCTYFDGSLQLVLGRDAAERRQNFAPLLKRLPEMLTPSSPEGGPNFGALAKLYSIGEYLYQDEPGGWRKVLAATLQPVAKELEVAWSARRPLRRVLWQQLMVSVREAAANPSLPAVTAQQFQDSWETAERLVAYENSGPCEKLVVAALPRLDDEAFRLNGTSIFETGKYTCEAHRLMILAGQADRRYTDAGELVAAFELASHPLISTQGTAADEALQRQAAVFAPEAERESVANKLALFTDLARPGLQRHAQAVAKREASGPPPADLLKLRSDATLTVVKLLDRSHTLNTESKAALQRKLYALGGVSEAELARQVAQQTTHPLAREFWQLASVAKSPSPTSARLDVIAKVLEGGPTASPTLSALLPWFFSADVAPGSPYLTGDQARIQKLMTSLAALDAPSPTGTSVEAALAALDEFSVAHFTKIDRQALAAACFASPRVAMHVAQRLRAPQANADRSQRWLAPLMEHFVVLGGQAVKNDRWASASGFYLYSHWLSDAGLQPIGRHRLTDGGLSGSLNPLGGARRYALYAIWYHAWAALDPKSPETPAVVELYAHDPVLARAHVVSVLGLEPGDPALFGPKYRELTRQTDFGLYSLSGNPPQWVQAENAPPATWPVVEPARLRQAREALAKAEGALSGEVERYQDWRRFMSLDKAKEDLAAFDGTRSSSGYTPNVDSAQRGLNEAQASYDKDRRDGVYVGRSLDRSDTIYTRELTSVERRQREYELERHAATLAQEQREAQWQQEQNAARSRERDRLTDEIFEKEKSVDTAGHLKKVAELKKDVRYWEEALERVLSQMGGRNADPSFSRVALERAKFVRMSWIGDTNDRYGQLMRQALESKSLEDQLEAEWYSWLIAIPETRTSSETRTTFFGTKESEKEAKDQAREGIPLADSALLFLEAAKADGPRQMKPRLPAELHPRLTVNPEWLPAQVDGLLMDAWIRLGPDPYEVGLRVVKVADALVAVTGSEEKAADALRPWVEKFRSKATEAERSTVLGVGADTPAARVIRRAAQPK